MTVADKLRAVLVRDDTGNGPVGLSINRLGLGPHGDRELDICTWAVVFGIAWGIARAENPFESDEEVGKRAMDIAWPQFLDFNGPITPGPRV
jgi:hypothetical protein